MCKIEIDGVSIVLTASQLKQIDEQRSKITRYDQIKSVEDACKVLGLTEIATKASDKLKLIAKAINCLIDDRDIRDMIKNPDIYVYYPYFELKKKGLGLVFYSSGYQGSTFDGEVAFTKTKESSEYLGKTFTYLYEELIEEY